MQLLVKQQITTIIFLQIMGDWGIKISSDGFDVDTAADKDLVLSSKFDSLKVKMTGTIQGTAGTISVEHGLGYVPIFFAAENYGSTSSIVRSSGNVWIDGTALNLLGGTSNPTYRYYVFYQQAV